MTTNGNDANANGSNSNNDDNQTGGATGYFTSLIKGIRDLGVLLIGFTVVILLVIYALRHFKDPKNELALLGVVLPAITAMTGFAFGVSAGATAGAASGKAAADAAEEKVKETREQVTAAKPAVDAAKQKLDSLEQQLREQLPKRAPEGDFLADPTQLQELQAGGGEIRISGDDIAAARDHLTYAQGQLDLIARSRGSR